MSTPNLLCIADILDYRKGVAPVQVGVYWKIWNEQCNPQYFYIFDIRQWADQ